MHLRRAVQVMPHCLSIVLLSVAALFVRAAAAYGAPCAALRDLPPRGFACFHCMHPNVPDKAAPFIEILETSCVRRPALSFVMDGSFGYDEKQIISAIDRLARGGRKFYLHLYLYNGPAQRRWYAGVFNSFAIMEPVRFRSLLRSNRRFQKLFRARVQMLLPILQYARNSGVRVSLAPAVEDNLDRVSFNKALALIRAEIPRDLRPRLVRSPCSDCYRGNDYSLPAGVAFEKHTISSDFTVRNGVVSTDGEYFLFSQDEARFEYPRLSDLAALRDRAGASGNIFLLWVPKYQDAPPGILPRSPETRRYLAPSAQEAGELRKYLANER